MPNRVTNPIIRGNQSGDYCRLLRSRAYVVENQPANDGSECSCDHSNAELDKNLQQISPPSSSVSLTPSRERHWRDYIRKN